MVEMIFELQDARYSYLGRIPALCGVDLKVEKGRKAALIGANGTGKSTLLAMLDALIFADRGMVRAFDRELKEGDFDSDDFSGAFRRKVGFVFQNPDVQLFCPTVKEDVLFGPLQLGVAPQEAQSRLERLSVSLGFEHLLDRSPHQLSIGEKKRVAIASVLAIEPEVLLLDEPTAGLDPQTTRHIIDIILAENEAGRTIVTATHDLHIIAEIADIVHVFGADKKIVRSAAADEILSDQAFLEDHNLVHIHRHKHKGVMHSHPHTHSDHHEQHGS